MGQYTLQSIKSNLREMISRKSGIPLYAVKTVHKEYKVNLARTQGMYLMRKNKLFDILPNIVKSQLDMKIIAYLTNNINSRGEVTKNKKAVTINDIAETFSVSRKKISTTIAAAVEHDLIKKNKRTLVINPYLVVPYNINNDGLYILQTYWDSNFTYDITEELEEAIRQFKENRSVDTPEL
jgi:hypothetical protein